MQPALFRCELCFPFVSSAVETPLGSAGRRGVSTTLDTNGTDL